MSAKAGQAQSIRDEHRNMLRLLRRLLLLLLLLLRRADWDVDGVRDDVRGYVTENLGDPDGVLIADETGFIKKGTPLGRVPGTAGSTSKQSVTIDPQTVVSINSGL
jgi:hypothetical protein